MKTVSATYITLDELQQLLASLNVKWDALQHNAWPHALRGFTEIDYITKLPFVYTEMLQTILRQAAEQPVVDNSFYLYWLKHLCFNGMLPEGWIIVHDTQIGTTDYD